MSYTFAGLQRRPATNRRPGVVDGGGTRQNFWTLTRQNYRTPQRLFRTEVRERTFHGRRLHRSTETHAVLDRTRILRGRPIPQIGRHHLDQSHHGPNRASTLAMHRKPLCLLGLDQLSGQSVQDMPNGSVPDSPHQLEHELVQQQRATQQFILSCEDEFTQFCARASNQAVIRCPHGGSFPRVRRA